ncbi:hypothetical protein [uncultured Dermacoccus sp.]|uniref:hypothetical protein n=1 Tax=uncultured Dermacoccus sp. TaxID=339343 RepID=UPI0025992F47|nr:hypothetical protein [uncultured Dermacoccus sp.]
MSILAAIVLDTITEADTLAFVEYLDAPRVRVRLRSGRGAPWHCEVHGQTAKPTCEHTRVVRDALKQHDRIR